MSRNFTTEEANPQTTSDEHRFFSAGKLNFPARKIIFLSAFICVHLWMILLLSCKSQPTDLRTLAPAETLIYLESKNLARTLEAITGNKIFQEAAKSKPDFSRLENVQFAVAITGFEASEKQITAENSVLNFKPHFVAIADTHAWNWQTISLVENQLNGFVKNTYGEDVSLEKTDKESGKWFAWTAKDESKVFAYVEESRVYFGNDAAAIEKCMAVKRGESENLLKNENLSRAYYAVNSENTLAFGYVSPDGVAQISNIAGVSAASEASEDGEGQSFVARVLPQILRNTTKEVAWTAQKSESGIEDKLSISLNAETVSVFKETLAVNQTTQTNLLEYLPANPFSVTTYNLKNPLVAWRSLLLVAAKSTDAVSGNLLVQFSNKMLASYGVSDAETFLSAVDSDILTAQFDADGDKSIVIATVKNAENLKKSLSKEINFKVSPQMQSNAEIWQSEDKTISAAFVENKLILGDAETVLKCLEAKSSGENYTKNTNFQKFNETKSIALTAAKDLDSAEKIAEVLSETKDENKKYVTNYLTETRVTEKGIERKTVSEFGLIGTIIEQIGE
jgi:hypothetical protein